MSPHLKTIQDLIQQNDRLSPGEKEMLLKSLSDAAKEFSITEFKLERTEKVKKTTGILLEETISELEQKRKAVEAQNRELEIEASLERVRAKVMAMTVSKDLNQTSLVFGEQLRKLDIDWQFSYFWLVDEPKNENVFWITWPDYKTSFSSYTMAEAEELYNDCLISWRAGVKIHDNYIPPAEVQAWLDTFERITDDAGGEAKKIMVKKTFPDGVFYYDAMMKYGSFGICISKPATEEEKKIQCRFAIEFERAYTRFLDLKHAEAQAREATIEAALEKVRGKAMAMHNSNDLSVTAALVFTELRKLGIDPVRCGVSLQSRESRKNLLYYSIPSADGDNLSLAGSALLANHPVLSDIYDCWIQGKEYFPVLRGESLISYYQTLREVGFDVPGSPVGHVQYGYYLPFSEGMFYGWSEKPYSETEIKLLKRFASVIDLTFRRYIELQKSEGNAREAVKQAALDRVRAEIASMRTTGDLDRITPLIWNELKILGIPFIRCGVFIMDEEQKLIHTFLSTPEGKAIAAFHLSYNTPGHFGEVLEHWRGKMIYVSRWSEEDFTSIANILVQQGAIAASKQYLDTLPKGGFFLHFLPFLQGMFYVGNSTQLGEDDIKLIQHVADAFSTAYARYEDFNNLEEAKGIVEKTLNELKSTQSQLIQSEKMASLGELTAGIAHEIQNPLNFVNNFSEVNGELIDEMKEQLAIGNGQLAVEIADDIKQNLEKINHHGKRAEAIVKGMLQHSRTGSGQKEPTNINDLADEYLRLAFHGLRAKEKSFNAKFETDFDASIENINVIPQDIGRVFLNLINNAFFAVNEKQKQNIPGYEPTIRIRTRKAGEKIEIKLADNGIGIPQKVLDKIFQPFFTTKPTGSGTGLGLSISYDIVRAHGGELSVNSREGEGSEFTVRLPITQG